jgi:hypothetical protein
MSSPVYGFRVDGTSATRASTLLTVLMSSSRVQDHLSMNRSNKWIGRAGPKRECDVMGRAANTAVAQQIISKRHLEAHQVRFASHHSGFRDR